MSPPSRGKASRTATATSPARRRRRAVPVTEADTWDEPRKTGAEMKRSTGAALAVLLLTACSPADEPEATRAEGAPTLRATVGTEESPDAFEIALLDEDGEPVTELPAGEYNIEVDDP